MTATVNIALLVLRLAIGLTIAAHGAQKGFGWFGGPGAAKVAQGFQAQGLRPGWFWTSLVLLGEIGGGLSVAFGLLTPLGAAGIVGAMLMAILKAHWRNGFWSQRHGYEYALQILAVAVAIGVAGPGAYSLDQLFGIKLPEMALFGILTLAAVIVDIVGLVISGQSAPSSQPVQPAR